MIDPLPPDVSTALRAASSVTELAAVVRTVAREVARAQGATFVVAEGDQCFYVDEDAIAPLWRGQRFPQSDCISGWAMIHAEQAIVPDTRLDARIPQAAYRPTFVRSLVMTPVGEPARAAIGTYWSRTHHPTRNELRALEFLAQATAVVLDDVDPYPAPWALTPGAG